MALVLLKGGFMLKELLLFGAIMSINLNVLPSYNVDAHSNKTITNGIVYDIGLMNSNNTNFDIVNDESYFYYGLPLYSDSPDYEYSLIYRLSPYGLYSSYDDVTTDIFGLHYTLLIGARFKDSNDNFQVITVGDSLVYLDNVLYIPWYTLGYGGGNEFSIDMTYNTSTLEFITNIKMREYSFTDDIDTTIYFDTIVINLFDFIPTFGYPFQLLNEMEFHLRSFEIFTNVYPYSMYLFNIFVDFGPSTLDYKEMGYIEGYDDGYNNGFDDGFISKGLDNWLVSLFGSLGALLNIQLLPNLTIGSIIMIFLAIPLTYAIIKLMKGGGD